MIEFFIDGVPKATQTGYIAINRRTGKPFPVRRNPEWIEHCKVTAREEMNTDAPLTGALECTLLFLFPTPRKSKTGYPANADLGNLEKGVLDAMNGIVYVDDGQIVRLLLAKRFAEARERPGVYVRIEPALSAPGA